MARLGKPATPNPAQSDAGFDRLREANIEYLKATELFVTFGGYDRFEDDTREWFKAQPSRPLAGGIVRLVFAVVRAVERRHEAKAAQVPLRGPQ